MPDSEPETPLGVLVRQNRLILSVDQIGAVRRAQYPDSSPLRGRVLDVGGIRHEVFGGDPFTLFDKIASWVMANYQPREEQPAFSAPGVVTLNPGVTWSNTLPVEQPYGVSVGMREAMQRAAQQVSTRYSQPIVITDEIQGDAIERAVMNPLATGPIISPQDGVWTA